MEFEKYQLEASKPIQVYTMGKATGKLIPFLGLIDEAGSDISELKKNLHDGIKSTSYVSKLKEEQGNILWYISSAEIIQEFIDIAKEIKKADKRSEELGLTRDELAFYEAVEANNSAKELLGDEILLKLARVLVNKVKENATIDWTVNESVKNCLKVIVKRTLREYGYPIDLQKLATDTKLCQVEFWND